MITLRQLEFAIAVAKFQHFRRAAEECNVSQSALSIGIAALEEQLGVQLFERNNKQVLITPIGEQIIERAQRILTDSYELMNLAKAQRNPLSSGMSLGLIPTIAPYLLPKVIPSLMEKHPEFHFEITEETSERLIEKVRNGSLDTAILALPYPVSGLHTFEFWAEDFYAITGAKSTHAGETTFDPATLKEGELMLLADGHCLSDHALSVCSLKSNDQVKRFEHASLSTLTQMALSNLGVTIVPEMALDQLQIKDPAKQVIPMKDKGPHRTLAFVTRLNYARVDDVRYLCSFFRDVLKSA